MMTSPVGGGGGGGLGGGFDMSKLFKPSPANPMNMMQPQIQIQQGGGGPSPPSNNPVATAPSNLTTSPSFPLPSSSTSSSSPPYLTPSSSYPPPTGPYHPYHHPPYLSPYPPPPQQLHNQFIPTTNLHQQNRQLSPPPISSFPPSPRPLSPNSSGGAVLMDILTNQNQQPVSNNLSGPLPSVSTTSIATNAPSPPVPSAPSVSLSSPTQQSSPTPMRMLSSKLPKGRNLTGSHVVYYIDVRLQGEVQPQLEVTPITKYVSDPGLVLGRQIAVNRNYICYGLKPGAIRILNINTALRSLLRGHSQVYLPSVFL